MHVWLRKKFTGFYESISNSLYATISLTSIRSSLIQSQTKEELEVKKDIQ